MRELDKWDKELLKRVMWRPRILGFQNEIDYIGIKKRLNQITLFVSAFPRNNKGKRITLESMGFNSKNCYKKDATEQFELKLTLKQAQELLNDLKKIKVLK